MNGPPINPFLAILSTWKTYFDNYYEGLGTTYERVLLHKIFQTLDEKYAVKNILEVPSFGMTGVSGINSMWWAMKGKMVTVVDTEEERLVYIKNVWQEVGLSARFLYHTEFSQLPFTDNEFDLAWNFAALWFVADLDTFASELRRVSRKVILIAVPNHTGWGYRLRKKYAKNLASIYLENIRPERIVNYFARDGWQLKEFGLFDVPPWPDIAMRKEDLFQKIGLQKLLSFLKIEDTQEQENKTTIIDFYAGRAPHLEKEIMRFAVLENAPMFFKKIWAHHRYFVFVPQTNENV